MLRLDPEKLYRATFICQDGLSCCNVALISFRLFRKNLGNLRDVFEQMVYRPPWQKISRTPMVTIFWYYPYDDIWPEFQTITSGRFYSLRLYDSRTRVFNIPQRCSQTGHSLVIVGRVFNKVHSGRLRHEVQPFILLIYHFWEKTYPFSIPSLDKWYPLHTYFRNSHPS